MELVQHFGQERFEFILNETQTHQIVEDVRNRFSDLGILYLCNNNENVLRKLFEEYNLNFYELFTAMPHIFIGINHPLAKRTSVKLEDLKPYPRLSFVQGTYESSNFSEELFSNEPVERSIKVSDRAAIVNLMIGLDGYTFVHGKKIYVPHQVRRQCYCRCSISVMRETVLSVPQKFMVVLSICFHILSDS